MKPVAWMIIDVDNGKSLQSKESKFSEINIPLYTSPRELSDEEIDEVVKKTYGESRNPSVRACYRRLARAILRKAQGD